MDGEGILPADKDGQKAGSGSSSSWVWKKSSTALRE